MTTVDRPADMEAVRDLKTLAAAAAERWGERPALTFDESGEVLSFADVERRSNTIANALLGLGLGPGDKVALMLRNRPEFPLGWLAITKIGAAMVPINVFYRQADAGYLLAHSEARAILTSAEFLPLIRSLDEPGLRLEHIVSVDGGEGATALDQLLSGAGEGAPEVEILPEHLANIQYTSGTTGRPKGCMLSHYYCVEFGRNIVLGMSGLDADDVMLTAQPFYYIDPQWNFVCALLSGAHLVVLDRFHPSSFWHKVREHRVTWFYCLGMMPRMLLKMPPEAADRDSRVRMVACSAIPPGLHAELEERWGAPWYEVYGLTEGGADMFVPLDEHDELVGSGCMGRTGRLWEARVVGEDGRPLPRGEIGELVLRGRAIMDGYFKNTEATAEIFRGGWLHTGDLARMDAEGRFYFVGRIKEMIRRSGENISSAEVEEIIEGHSAVRMAACIPVPDELRGEEVKAYIVLKDGATPESAPPPDLAAHCADRLAYFKVPRYWTYRDDLPRTPSERVMKDVLAKEQDDLREGAYDAVDGVWR